MLDTPKISAMGCLSAFTFTIGLLLLDLHCRKHTVCFHDLLIGLGLFAACARNYCASSLCALGGQVSCGLLP